MIYLFVLNFAHVAVLTFFSFDDVMLTKVISSHGHDNVSYILTNDTKYSYFAFNSSLTQ